MRKIYIILGLILISIGCTNKDIEFDDFEFEAVYFPFQTPLRPLMLGDEVVGDNSIDLERAFSIGATVGGAYKNNFDREISIELAPELALNLTDDDNNPLELLPSNYYNATFDKITIPAGSFIGKMRVDLTDAFFEDPLSTGLHYVIPVKMTAVKGADSILQGDALSFVAAPDRRVSSDWAIVPKDYVLFGIKYVNPTHGVYLLRGQRKNLDDPTKDVSYSTRFLDDNINTKLSTFSLNQSTTTQLSDGGRFEQRRNAKYTMLLTFDEANNSVVVSQRDASTIEINGTGKIYSKDDSESEGYNGSKHRTIYLDYTFEDRGVSYQVNDSLVFIDTDIKFEEFAVKVTP